LLTSYNGWTASANPADFGGIEPLVIAGENFGGGVRKGDVHYLFQCFWTDFHNEVEPLFQAGWHEADEWGGAFRLNRNANNLSCHASWTACDGNATRHPNGVPASKTFTPAQIDKIRWLCKVKYRGLLRWGGDFTGTPDAMHVEVIGTVGQVAALVIELKKAQGIPGVVIPAPSGGVQYEPRVDAPLGSRILSLGKVGDDVGFVQRWLGLKDDDEFGPATKMAVEAYQKVRGLGVDGIVGKATWAQMGIGSVPNLPAPSPAPQPWLMLPAVRSRPLSFQKWYNAYDFKPSLLPIIKPLANNFGPQSEAALKKVQARYHLTADGIDGPLTKRLLWSLGWRG